MIFEMLEDLIVAATNEALRKVDEESSSAMVQTDRRTRRRNTGYVLIRTEVKKNGLLQ